MKKIFCLLLTFCLCISLAACTVGGVTPSYNGSYGTNTTTDNYDIFGDLNEFLTMFEDSYYSYESSGYDSSFFEDFYGYTNSENYTAPQTEYDTEALETEGRGSEGQTWAVYWYLCGSDLESYNACATEDLLEMMEVKLSPNVKVVIQTGGAARWQNNTISANSIERYLYTSEGLERLERQAQANMGDSETLADFLSFCKTNYPADKTMVLFWNHGGGSVSGAVFDENYRNDSLTLGEFYEAFNAVYELDTENPPIDVIGFDTCLMATIDVAFTFCDIAEYLIASEEVEPGSGWLYSAWLQELSNDPGMGGAKLGKVICDTYARGCREKWQDSEITLSVTDLTKLEPLINAYDAMGQEALTVALDDSSFINQFSRAARSSENYGGNSAYEGYTNMVDLGHLVSNASQLLPKNSQAVLDALNDCVIYKINGNYRSNASGLSCYYSYNNDRKDYQKYTELGCSQAFKYFYDYTIDGNLSAEGMYYVSQLGQATETVPEIESFESGGYPEDLPVYVDDDGYVTLDVGSDFAQKLVDVQVYLCRLFADDDMLLMLGKDNDIEADWQHGIFSDDFGGVWGAIDNHVVYMELIESDENYNTYSVPILLNDEQYNLHVVYDFSSECYNILGARKEISEEGMADKYLIRLRPGDKISTIHYASTITGNDGISPIVYETFTVTKKTTFTDVELADGDYAILFELTDSLGNSIWSEMAILGIDGDYIYVP